jgi:hypothetical protein
MQSKTSTFRLHLQLSLQVVSTVQGNHLYRTSKSADNMTSIRISLAAVLLLLALAAASLAQQAVLHELSMQNNTSADGILEPQEAVAGCWPKQDRPAGDIILDTLPTANKQCDGMSMQNFRGCRLIFQASHFLTNTSKKRSIRLVAAGHQVMAKELRRRVLAVSRRPSPIKWVIREFNKCRRGSPGVARLSTSVPWWRSELRPYLLSDQRRF